MGITNLKGICTFCQLKVLEEALAFNGLQTYFPSANLYMLLQPELQTAALGW